MELFLLNWEIFTQPSASGNISNLREQFLIVTSTPVTVTCITYMIDVNHHSGSFWGRTEGTKHIIHRLTTQKHHKSYSHEQRMVENSKTHAYTQLKACDADHNCSQCKNTDNRRKPHSMATTRNWLWIWSGWVFSRIHHKTVHY